MINNEDRIGDNVKYFCDNRGWSYSFAQSFFRGHGKCSYCGVDLLSSWNIYSTSSLDHLLPQSKYPEISEEPANWAITCGACNFVKRTFDPLPGKMENGTVREYVVNHREELLSRVKEEISLKKKQTEYFMKEIAERL